MAAVRLDPFWVLPELYALANIERLRSLGKNSGAATRAQNTEGWLL